MWTKRGLYVDLYQALINQNTSLLLQEEIVLFLMRDRETAVMPRKLAT